MFFKFDDKLINFDMLQYVEINDADFSIDFYFTNKNKVSSYFSDSSKIKEEFEKLYEYLNSIKKD